MSVVGVQLFLADITIHNDFFVVAEINYQFGRLVKLANTLLHFSFERLNICSLFVEPPMGVVGVWRHNK